MFTYSTSFSYLFLATEKKMQICCAKQRYVERIP